MIVLPLPLTSGEESRKIGQCSDSKNERNSNNADAPIRLTVSRPCCVFHILAHLIHTEIPQDGWCFESSFY